MSDDSLSDLDDEAKDDAGSIRIELESRGGKYHPTRYPVIALFHGIVILLRYTRTSTILVLFRLLVVEVISRLDTLVDCLKTSSKLN